MNSRRFMMAVWLFALTCALNGSLGVAQARAAAEEGGVHGTAAAAQESAREINPRYLLMDDKGRAITSEDFAGRFQLIAFGYISCPDVCPTTLAAMAWMLDQLGEQGRQVQMLFVSLDPERDTPEILKRYTENFDPRILGLTGSPQLVQRVAEHFKVKYAKIQEPGAPANAYTLDHSTGMYLLAPDGRFLTRFAYTAPAEEIVARLRDYVRQPPLQ